MKFGFVSHGLPPSRYVQSVMIYRVLQRVRPDDYCLITQDYGKHSPNDTQWGEKLPAKYYYLSRHLNFERGTRFSLIRWFNILTRASQIARIVKREKCEAVVACTSEFFDLPAAFFASRFAGIKFYPYLFDYYSDMATGSAGEAAAAKLEHRMMKASAGIIVPNEFLATELRRRYDVEATIVRNPVDLSSYQSLPPYDSRLNTNDEIKIVYTGSIYHAHYGAFRNLLAALDLVKAWNIKLHVYTNQPADLLSEKGIKGKVKINAAVPVAAVPALQGGADLLFLPLEFNARHDQIIRTSSPGKVGEYLASRRPILVHTPPDSFLNWYFSRYDCGLVVSDNDPTALATGIERFLTDAALRNRLVENAWERAQVDFSLRSSQEAYAKLLKLQLVDGPG